jgi:hypothetical protein
MRSWERGPGTVNWVWLDTGWGVNAIALRGVTSALSFGVPVHCG